MGALTSKVYSFVVRSWELEKEENIDYFDSFGNLIYIEKKNVELIRILPRNFNDFNWISDKIRFFYDSLKYQRIIKPLYYNINYANYSPVSWVNFYFFIKSFVLSGLFKHKMKYNFFVFYKDPFDLVDLISLREFVYSVSYNFYYINSFDLVGNSGIDNDYLKEVIFDPKLILKTSNLFLFGSDIRLELPVLALKLFDRVRKNALNLFIFGYVYYMNINFYSIGFSLYDFYNFRLNKMKKLRFSFIDLNFFFVFGFNFYNDVNFNSYYNYLIKIFGLYEKKFKLIFFFCRLYNKLVNINENLVGFPKTSIDGMLNFNNQLMVKNFYKENHVFFAYNYLLDFFINVNDYNYKNKFLSLNKKNYLNIFYGYQLDNNVSKNIYNFILPVPFIYEKDFYSFNCMGVLNISKYVYFPIKNNLIKSFYLLSKFLGDILLKANSDLNDIIGYFLNNENFYFINLKKTYNNLNLFLNDFVFGYLFNKQVDMFIFYLNLDNSLYSKNKNGFVYYKYNNNIVSNMCYNFYKTDMIVRNSVNLQLLSNKMIFNF